ncbi:MAG: nucleotidyltransferase domain-containing protein [Clostridia bacterium]|jgi:predicted nucleotidyltransferase
MLDERFGIDLDAVRGFLRNRELVRTRILDERYAQASSDFSRLVDMMIEKFNPNRIYQWGSLLDRERFSEISDIDIAVEGLSGPQEFFTLLGEALPLTDFPLDIVEIEKVGDDNASYIREYGRVVYERPA